MGALDLLTAPLRSALGLTKDAEREVETHSPARETGELEHQLDRAVTSIHHAAKSMESEVEVIQTLADLVPGLTASVNALVEEMHALNSALKPITSADRDLSKLGHLFGRRHAGDATTPAETQASPQPPAEPGST